MSRWNKAEDILPEESGDYLVACREDTIIGVIITYCVTPYSAKHKKWNHYDDLGANYGHCFDDVYAWAKIPECRV